MKILNLYAGVGGNRKLWGDDHEVTAIEYNQEIADVYKSYFPNDEVIVTDAHEYLLKHFQEYDFIWSSPPCPTHSDIRRCGVKAGQYRAMYPEMSLYQEILLLKHFFSGLWVVENVKPYYTPLISPTKELHRHLFWSNFYIPKRDFEDKRRHNDITGSKTIYGYDIKDTNIKDKRKVLRNMVLPELGRYVLDTAMGVKTYDKTNQTNIFENL